MKDGDRPLSIPSFGLWKWSKWMSVKVWKYNKAGSTATS